MDLKAVLIYAATGNPRVLLKSVYEASEKLTSLKKANNLAGKCCVYLHISVGKVYIGCSERSLLVTFH